MLPVEPSSPIKHCRSHFNHSCSLAIIFQIVLYSVMSVNLERATSPDCPLKINMNCTLVLWAHRYCICTLEFPSLPLPTSSHFRGSTLGFPALPTPLIGHLREDVGPGTQGTHTTPMGLILQTMPKGSLCPSLLLTFVPNFQKELDETSSGLLAIFSVTTLHGAYQRGKVGPWTLSECS